MIPLAAGWLLIVERERQIGHPQASVVKEVDAGSMRSIAKLVEVAVIIDLVEKVKGRSLLTNTNAALIQAEGS
jgi:uncharacterized protein YlaN (UPF0358 family)